MTPTPESRCRWAYHHLSVSYHVILGHHSFPLMFLQHTVEQDRAPSILSHHAKLARQATGEPHRRRRTDCGNHDQNGTEGRMRSRRAHLREGHQGQRCRDGCPRYPRRHVPSRMELFGAPTAGKVVTVIFACLLSWTLANFRTGKSAKCPRIRVAREYFIGPWRAQNRKKIRGTSEMPAKSPFPGPENWPKSS